MFDPLLSFRLGGLSSSSSSFSSSSSSSRFATLLYKYFRSPFLWHRFVLHLLLLYRSTDFSFARKLDLF